MLTLVTLIVLTSLRILLEKIYIHISRVSLTDEKFNLFIAFCHMLFEFPSIHVFYLDE